MRAAHPQPGPVAFVLGGGGGPLGAHEVGMLRALLERGIVPDLVLGTSVGAINGAAVAADPTRRGVERLAELCARPRRERRLRRLRAAARADARAHAHAPARQRDRCAPGSPRRSGRTAGSRTSRCPFQCVAASIERAAEHWFADGPLVDAVLASAAVPGLLPPVEIGGEHFIDGGIVNSIPVSRAVTLGARRIFVLHVGRLDRPLEPPRWPWEVGLVAFEIARRHRFLGDLAALPEGVDVHVLPTGQQDPPRYTDLSQLRYRDTSSAAARIAQAHEATARYLDEHDLGSAVIPSRRRSSGASSSRRSSRSWSSRSSSCRPCSSLVAAIASPLTGGAWRPLRVVAIVVAWAAPPPGRHARVPRAVGRQRLRAPTRHGAQPARARRVAALVRRRRSTAR